MAFIDSGIEPTRRIRFQGRPPHPVPAQSFDQTWQPQFDATYIREAIRECAPLYAKVERVISPLEWAAHAPTSRLSGIRNANGTRSSSRTTIMTPEIFHGVADIIGDSLQLAKEAGKTDADVIVQGGVHFMAETSKLLNPTKTVLIPDMRADVLSLRRLRRKTCVHCVRPIQACLS